MTEWFEQDDSWEIFADKMFSFEIMESAIKEVNSIISLLNIKADATVLDCPCGVGRHSFEFARSGFNVTGVDKTEKYLYEARKRAEKEKLVLEFIKSDMREFRRPDTFDAVVNLWNSFGYFENIEDDLKVLGNFYDSLKENGKFLIDVYGKEVVVKLLRKKDWYEEDDGSIFLDERKISDDCGKLFTRWILIDKDNNRKEFTYFQRLYSGTELVELVKKAGFKDVKIYGGFDGSPYNLDADRLVVTGVK